MTRPEAFHIIHTIDGEDIVHATHETVGGAIAHRNVLHLARPFDVLAIWSSITGIVQPPRTLLQRRQYGDYMQRRGRAKAEA